MSIMQQNYNQACNEAGTRDRDLTTRCSAAVGSGMRQQLAEQSTVDYEKNTTGKSDVYHLARC